MHRKAFLKAVIKISFIFLGILGLPFIISLKSFKVKSKETRFFYLANIDEMPEKNIKKFSLDISKYMDKERNNSGINLRPFRIYVVKIEDQWIALLPVCTHLGCLVNYNRIKNEFICPCHSGRYTITGSVISGPPGRPLTMLPLKIERDNVFVGLKV